MIPVSMAEKKAPVALPAVPVSGFDDKKFMPIPPGGPQTVTKPAIQGFTFADTARIDDVGNLL
jgi:hypothetical protein